MTGASRAYEPRWQDRLEPFGYLVADMDERIEAMVRAMSDDELAAVEDAALQVSTTNCWCYAFQAAPFVKAAASMERSRRRAAFMEDEQPSDASSEQPR